MTKQHAPSLGGDKKESKGQIQLGGERARLHAIDALSDADPGVVRRAVSMLKAAGDVRSLDRLRQILHSTDWMLHYDVVDALEAIGTPAIEDMVYVLQSERFQPRVREKAGRALIRLREPSALASVQEYMLVHSNADCVVPALLQDILKHVEDRDHKLEIILDFYRAPNLTSNLRVHAIVALGLDDFVSDEIFDILSVELHRSLWTRRAAIMALGRNFRTRAAPVLEHIYNHPFDNLEDRRATVFTTGLPDTDWNSLIRIIIEHAGLEYVFEEYGPSGVALASLLQPDGVFVCWMMLPESSGLDIVDQCQSLIPGVRTILLSAMTQRADIVRAKSHGVTRYVLAPTGPSELQQAFLDLAEPNPEHIRRLAARALSACQAQR